MQFSLTFNSSKFRFLTDQNLHLSSNFHLRFSVAEMGSHMSVLPTNTKVFINNEPFCLLKSHRVQTAAPSSTWLHEFFFFKSFFFFQLKNPASSTNWLQATFLHWESAHLSAIRCVSRSGKTTPEMLKDRNNLISLTCFLGFFFRKEELATCILFLFQPTYWFLVRKSDSKTSFLF